MNRVHSSLLWDAVRVMVRLLQEADTLIGEAAFVWHNHRRAAKRSGARHPVHPRATEPGSALPRADQAHAGDPGLCGSGSDAKKANGKYPTHDGRPLASQPPHSVAR